MSISSLGAVESIQLVTQKPLEQVRTVSAPAGREQQQWRCSRPCSSSGWSRRILCGRSKGR